MNCAVAAVFATLPVSFGIFANSTSDRANSPLRIHSLVTDIRCAFISFARPICPAHPSISPLERTNQLFCAEIAYKILKMIYPFRPVFWYNHLVIERLWQIFRAACAVHSPHAHPSGAFHDRQSPIRTFCFSDGRTRRLCPASVACTASGPEGSAEQARKHHHKRKEVRA